MIRAEPEDVPVFLGAADVALSIIRPSYARIASSPTKFAEYLAAGLPVISTAGIGDVEAHIEEARVGAVMRTLDRDVYGQALQTIETLRRDPELATRCRQLAHTRYDLETVGGASYLRLYQQLHTSPS